MRNRYMAAGVLVIGLTPGALAYGEEEPTITERGLPTTQLAAGATETSTTDAGLTVKWRGSVWASGTTQQRRMTDNSLLLRATDAGEDALSLDGVTLGMDVDLAKGWSIKTTIIGGQAARILNQTNGEAGAVAISEAQVSWSGDKDKLSFGRMSTYLGMEFLDGSQDITASRGILFTYIDPYGQIGGNWHHEWSKDWSTDVWVFNGEDRIVDNNRAKTVGLGVAFAPGGATDKYISLQAYRGAEQDSRGTFALAGAEDRQRLRLAVMGQWAWGDLTVQGEGHLGQEDFAAGVLGSATPAQTAHWAAAGAIARYGIGEWFGVFARGEGIYDESGVRLVLDSNIANLWGLRAQARLHAMSYAVGGDLRVGKGFVRLEGREDLIDHAIADAAGRSIRNGASATVCVGASF